MDCDEKNNADSAKERIERCFRLIEIERMAGIPILNRALRVEVVGLDRFGNEWLCILVTPWFMNIVLLPVSQTSGGHGETPPSAVGSKSVVAFPAGSFEMIHGFEEGIGRYRMCSLFSPMHDFADHKSAIATAEAARAALLEDDADREADAGMAMIWRGERPHERRQQDPPDVNNVHERSAATSHAQASEDGKAEVGLSRRSLFLGRSREAPEQ